MEIAFIGNPNCGKTTLFNAYTGAGLKTANRPGVTFEKTEGKIKFRGEKITLVDLPGVYSLSSYTPEERVSREYINCGGADVIIDVIDASNAERNLYLALQLTELGVPVVLALNMMDIAKKRGITIDGKKLGKIMGAEAVFISASKGKGLDRLLSAAIKAAKTAPNHKQIITYSAQIEEKIDILSAVLKKKYPNTENYRANAVKMLEANESEARELFGADDEPKIISEKYDFIEKIIAETVMFGNENRRMTDRADEILAHPVFGMPIFLLIMAAVFFLTFAVGDAVKAFFDGWLQSFTIFAEDFLARLNVNDTVSALVADGIIPGVGGVLTFIPNIFILFLALGFLEDSGYMARAAYVTDGIMSKIGLSGRAFIPLILGFGCSVPAILATKTLEGKFCRFKTIMMIPFMSCSAKLPVYVLLSGIFFGKYAIFAAYSMYLIGFLAAFCAAHTISKAMPEKSQACLLEELPDYKLPSMRTVLVYAGEKIRDYLAKAGTTIFAASVIMWILLNFGFDGRVFDMSKSFCAEAARRLVPIMSAAGLGNWRIIASLISGVAAKEVIISSMSVMYGIGNISSAGGREMLAAVLSSEGFGAVNAYAMMTFSLLYVPCVASLAAIYRETNSIKITACLAALHIALAYAAAVAIFQLGRMIF